MIVYINTKVLNLFCISCLKRENANHCTINYMNMIKMLFFFLCYCVFFLCRDFLNFLGERKKKLYKSLGSTTLPALDKKDQTVTIHPLMQSTHIHTHVSKHKHTLKIHSNPPKTHTLTKAFRSSNFSKSKLE